MGLGILEPTSPQTVPGTVTLYDSGLIRHDAAAQEAGTTVPAASQGKGDAPAVLLVPRPSDSVNDPLKWPLWKKDLTLFIICLAAAVGGTVGPALAPVNAVLTTEFNTTYTTVANFSGYQFMASGAVGLLCEVMARLWGKRPIYVFSTSCLFAGSLWNAMVKSGDVGGFMGARVLQGIGLGAFETMVVSSIGDMYFVHQRGTRIALYNFLFLGTTYFTPVIAGYISVTYGWRMQFKIISAFMGAVLLLMFLFCPEHAFIRDRKFETDWANISNGSVSQEAHTGEEKMEGTDTANVTGNTERKKTFWDELKLYNGRFSDEGFWKLLLAPFPCMLYPATIWVFLIQGTFVTWGIGVSVVLAQIFSAPPHNFNPQQLGYIYAAPTIGAILAYLLSSLTADSVALSLTRRNKSIYEPEFRILGIIPIFLTGIPGLFAYGHAAVVPGLHWIVPSFLYGLLTFAVVMSCTVTYSYVLDAHRELSVEMMVAVLLLKNFFAWGSTYYLPNWIVSHGPPKVFDTMGAIQTVVCVGSVVMYIYGKKWRAAMGRWKPLEKFGVMPVGKREASR